MVCGNQGENRHLLAHESGAVAIDAAHRRARDVVHGQDVTITPPAMLLQRLQLHRQRCCCDVHDCCFSAGAALLDAELVPHVAVAPLLHVDGNLEKMSTEKHFYRPAPDRQGRVGLVVTQRA